MERIEYFKNYREVCEEVKRIINREVKARVFVFGSVVRGDFCIGLSDIDIAIVADDFTNRELKLKVYDLLFFKYFDSPLQFHLLTQEQWEFYRRFIGKDFVEI